VPIDLRSDNTLGGSPEILDAIARANEGSATPYGNDAITKRLRARCCELFETEVDVYPVITGTAANALSIAALTPSNGKVLCHADAHIVRDENGAPELLSGGAELVSIEGDDGKLSPRDVEAHITEEVTTLSLTTVTEAGTLYSLAEMRALCEVAKSRGFGVHLDGARFANAVASLGHTPAELTWKAGVDILAFGATKNGALSADLIVLFRRELKQRLDGLVHKSGHRLSKMRFLSAQLDAYLADDLWLRNASHANACAKRIAGALRGAPGVEILRPVEANIVFARITAEIRGRLAEQDVRFYDWPIFGEGAVRFVTGFATRSQDVDQMVNLLTMPAPAPPAARS
jgi:threonine aldolase